MASASQRMVHQDYIARIRYSNALPPPPNPLKLLDIPNTGLSSGQYTTPGFASRLARDQPLNIEADAELGMPLDLVGMPGIFDGDESSIQAPLQYQNPHPHDRALLRPLAALGKPKADLGVSFLRRTEYISSYTTKNQFNVTRTIDPARSRQKKHAGDVDRESPEYITSQAEKSFEISAANLKNRNIKHPSKPNLKLLDSYPLLPDLDAFPDIGGYMTIKFMTNPVPPSSTYDVRIESSVLRPTDKTDEEEELIALQRQAYELDPARNPPPQEGLEYELYMADSASETLNLKRKFDVFDPDKDSDDLYTQLDESGRQSIRFKRIRAYETAKQDTFQNEQYDHDVLFVTHDGSDGLRQKGVYYYPVMQETSIRPQRKKNIDRRYLEQDNDNDKIPDLVDIRVEDADEETQKIRDQFREHPYGEAYDEQPVEEEIAPTQAVENGTADELKDADGEEQHSEA